MRYAACHGARRSERHHLRWCQHWHPSYPAYPFESRLSLTYTLSGTELTVT